MEEIFFCKLQLHDHRRGEGEDWGQLPVCAECVDLYGRSSDPSGSEKFYV